MSEYGVKVLLDMALSAYIVTWHQDKYCLANLGYFLLHDGMTNANMDFTADVLLCRNDAFNRIHSTR